jgi:hypothetical protein
VPRPLNASLPKCPAHPGSAVRADGTYGSPPKPRLRCFYRKEDGNQGKHGLRPAPKPSGTWEELPGGRYSVTEVATALTDLARGTTYTEAARRIQVNHNWQDFDGTDEAPEPRSLDGRTVAVWLDRFGSVIAGAYEEKAWPETLVLDSTEFGRTNPRGGGPEQLFTVLAAWGYPAGAKRGRLWALKSSATDDGPAWAAFLRQMPGRPAMVVYDSDKAIHSAVRRKWPSVPIHLCEHHLYVNAKKRLAEDGEHGYGNTFRTLLNNAAHGPEGWAAFRGAVLAADLPKTAKWVRHWDKQLTAQNARRASIPPHYSTGALDPQIAVVRQFLERRRWTFRNKARMDALLSLIRLHVNRRDVIAEWAALIAVELDSQQSERLATLGDLRSRPKVKSLIEAPQVLLDGSRVYSLRKHPVPARSNG